MFTCYIIYLFVRPEDSKEIYTVSHKKRATLCLIITPAFHGRFLWLTVYIVLSV